MTAIGFALVVICTGLISFFDLHDEPVSWRNGIPAIVCLAGVALMLAGFTLWLWRVMP